MSKIQIISWICILVYLTKADDGMFWAKKKYDFIIVGGGTAGCVIAARLSENPAVSVLMLEAGPLDTDDPFVSVPRTTLSVIRGGSNWLYTAEPQQENMDSRVFKYKVGKMLGGSSSHNGMTIARASKHDFDTWEAMGNDGWGYEDVLPYYKKYENVYGEGLQENAYRGVGGPVSISLTHKLPMTDLFIRSGEKLGWPVTDYFGPQDDPGKVAGFGYGQINTDSRGVRSSTAEAYIRPIMGRWNLDIVTGALVTKLKIKKRKVQGVFFEKDGVLHFVKAKHDVILSAGSFASAQLLMVSGIGPKKHLQDLGIKVLKDLPVGRSLHDRFLVKVPFTNVGTKISETTLTFDELFKYVFTGKGSWTTIGQMAVGLFRTKSQPEDNKSSYIMISFRQNMPSMAKPLGDAIRNGDNYEDSELYEQFKHSQDGQEGFTMWIFHLSPRITGEMNLKTDDIHDYPQIIQNFLQDDKDYEDVIEGVRLIQELVQTNVFSDEGVNITHVPFPACAHTLFDSSEYWRCFIQKKGEAGTQPFATCSMGPDSDQKAVVDNNLKVKGIHGLRVADASIIPLDFAGNPMLQVIMIGEKAADIIKDAYGLNGVYHVMKDSKGDLQMASSP